MVELVDALVLINVMSGRVGTVSAPCRHHVGTMSKLVGMWHAMARSMSKRDAINKLMSSDLALSRPKIIIHQSITLFGAVEGLGEPQKYLRMPQGASESLREPQGVSLVHWLGRKFSPVFYRTSSTLGPLPGQ